MYISFYFIFLAFFAISTAIIIPLLPNTISSSENGASLFIALKRQARWSINFLFGLLCALFSFVLVHALTLSYVVWSSCGMLLVGVLLLVSWVKNVRSGDRQQRARLLGSFVDMRHIVSWICIFFFLMGGFFIANKLVISDALQERQAPDYFIAIRDCAFLVFYMWYCFFIAGIKLGMQRWFAVDEQKE